MEDWDSHPLIAQCRADALSDIAHSGIRGDAAERDAASRDALAERTTRATADFAGQIARVRTSTGQAVSAIGSVATRIQTTSGVASQVLTAATGLPRQSAHRTAEVAHVLETVRAARSTARTDDGGRGGAGNLRSVRAHTQRGAIAAQPDGTLR